LVSWFGIIRHEILVKLEENPAFFASLRERLEQIIADRKAKRIDAAQQLKLFEVLTKEIRGHADAAEKLGLSETGFAIYGLLRGDATMPLAEKKGGPTARSPTRQRQRWRRYSKNSSNPRFRSSTGARRTTCSAQCVV
jgi:type I restriction enzyme R subunit